MFAPPPPPPPPGAPPPVGPGGLPPMSGGSAKKANAWIEYAAFVQNIMESVDPENKMDDKNYQQAFVKELADKLPLLLDDGKFPLKKNELAFDLFKKPSEEQQNSHEFMLLLNILELEIAKRIPDNRMDTKKKAIFEQLQRIYAAKPVEALSKALFEERRGMTENVLISLERNSETTLSSKAEEGEIQQQIKILSQTVQDNKANEAEKKTLVFFVNLELQLTHDALKTKKAKTEFLKEKKDELKSLYLSTPPEDISEEGPQQLALLKREALERALLDIDSKTLFSTLDSVQKALETRKTDMILSADIQTIDSDPQYKQLQSQLDALQKKRHYYELQQLTKTPRYSARNTGLERALRSRLTATRKQDDTVKTLLRRLEDEERTRQTTLDQIDLLEGRCAQSETNISALLALSPNGQADFEQWFKHHEELQELKEEKVVIQAWLRECKVKKQNAVEMIALGGEKKAAGEKKLSEAEQAIREYEERLEGSDSSTGVNKRIEELTAAMKALEDKSIRVDPQKAKQLKQLNLGIVGTTIPYIKLAIVVKRGRAQDLEQLEKDQAALSKITAQVYSTQAELKIAKDTHQLLEAEKKEEGSYLTHCDRRKKDAGKVKKHFKEATAEVGEQLSEAEKQLRKAKEAREAEFKDQVDLWSDFNAVNHEVAPFTEEELLILEMQLFNEQQLLDNPLGNTLDGCYHPDASERHEFLRNALKANLKNNFTNNFLTAAPRELIAKTLGYDVDAEPYYDMFHERQKRIYQYELVKNAETYTNTSADGPYTPEEIDKLAVKCGIQGNNDEKRQALGLVLARTFRDYHDYLRVPQRCEEPSGPLGKYPRDSIAEVLGGDIMVLHQQRLEAARLAIDAAATAAGADGSAPPLIPQVAPNISHGQSGGGIGGPINGVSSELHSRLQERYSVVERQLRDEAIKRQEAQQREQEALEVARRAQQEAEQARRERDAAQRRQGGAPAESSPDLTEAQKRAKQARKKFQ